MGTKVLAAADYNTKPNYVVSTVLAASVAIIDGQFAVWVGNLVNINLDAYAGLVRCGQALREAGWPNPVTDEFSAATYDPITGILVVTNGAVQTFTEEQVAVMQGLDFTQSGDSNSPHVRRMAESFLESVKAGGVPTVDTPTFADVTDTTATLGGTVSSDGGRAITERGTVWGLTADPNIIDEAANKDIVAGTTGVFTGPVTSLPDDTLIHFRAYATNSEGTSYSTDDTFTTDAT
jgi:hypothetical protein